jgi:hypothetical protein
MMHTPGPWTPEPPAPTRLYSCAEYPRRVRAESPSAAAAIVARYLARQRFGRAARPWSVGQAGWDQHNVTGRTVAWHYQSTVVGRASRRGGGYPILGELRIVVRA